MPTPKGHTKYILRPDMEREIVVKYLKKGMRNTEIADLIGWTEEEVQQTKLMFWPTAGLARDFLKANALKLAVRVVNEANVEEAVDILSRPNMGILDPAVKQQLQRPLAIVTNINTSTLGGVTPASSIQELPMPLALPSSEVMDVDEWTAPVPASVSVPDPVPVHVPVPSPPEKARKRKTPTPKRKASAKAIFKNKARR